MYRDLSSLQESQFDLVVIGGGIFGAFTALDAAQRGLSVALIEKDDFCGATSANSFKLIHGGIRYLQHGDLPRVRQSSAARRVFLRIAPHLVQPLPIVVPTYGYGRKSKWLMRAAMATYDAVTLDRNTGIRDMARTIPRGHCLDRESVISRYPGINKEGLTGAAVFCDGQMYNPPRLVLSALKTAVSAGAVVANYVEAESIVLKNGQVVALTARDRLRDVEIHIKARTIVNAAGPYAEPLIKKAAGLSVRPSTNWSRDAYFILSRPLIGGRSALALQATTSDPDARLSRGNRHLFLVPWRGYTLAGVWHRVYEGPPDQYRVEENEKEAFVQEINEAYRGLDLSVKDASQWVSGLIPFGENNPEASDLSFGHRSRLIDHAETHGVDGLISLVGVRFTTGPIDASEAVDLVTTRLGKKAGQSRLSECPLVGGSIDDFEATVREAESSRPESVPKSTVRALVHNYGTEYERIYDYARKNAELGRPLGDANVLRAEIEHAFRSEMAETLADVIFRRTDLGTGGHPGADALADCASIARTLVNWDEGRVQREVERVEAQFPATRSENRAISLEQNAH